MAFPAPEPTNGSHAASHRPSLAAAQTKTKKRAHAADLRRHAALAGTPTRKRVGGLSWVFHGAPRRPVDDPPQQLTGETFRAGVPGLLLQPAHIRRNMKRALRHGGHARSRTRTKLWTTTPPGGGDLENGHSESRNAVRSW